VTAPKQDKGPLRKRGYKPAPINQRFWSKVDVSNPFGCWPWLGYRYNGYGRFNYRGRSTKAHRVAWFLRHGFVSSDKHICHRCDNPPCCNPDHLRLGTNGDNVTECNQKGRQTRGERTGTSKLTEKAVREIRASLEFQRVLARRYRVSQQNISLIQCGKAWGWLQ
jgi:hypothetical protein